MSGARRRSQLAIPFLQLFADIAAIECAFILSYWLRFYSPLTVIFPVVKGIPPLEVYVKSSLAVIVLWLFVAEALGLYGARRNAGRIDEFITILKTTTLVLLLAAAALFFYRGFFYSRLVFVYLWAVSIGLLTAARFSLILWERSRHRAGKGLVRAAIIGSNELGRNLLGAVRAHAGLGITIVGHIGENPHLEGEVPCLGESGDLARIIKQFELDMIFIALSEAENRRLIPILVDSAGMDIEFYLVPDVLRLITSRLRVEHMDGLPLLKIKELAITGWRRVFKRGCDLVLSGLGLVILLPLFLLAALAVKIDSRGPVFYSQRRVGLDGREFSLLKFRSMRPDAEREQGPVWAVAGDSRVTAVGRILRRFSLDELPQLINVLKGDMSLVGPRPERPHFVAQFKARVPKYLERHRVKSGMTGWAQVNGLRGNVPIEERTKLDVYYVENYSFFFDLKIILMTIWAVIEGKNSY